MCNKIRPQNHAIIPRNRDKKCIAEMRSRFGGKSKTKSKRHIPHAPPMNANTARC